MNIGDKKNRLTLIEMAESKRQHKRAIFKCDCETVTKPIAITLVNTGQTKSCGCLQKELAKINGSKRKTHGMSKSPEYYTWAMMTTRCTNPNQDNYYLYGGRGIKVCDRWKSFSNFYEDMGNRPKGKTLNRIDNDGDYCKENCNWLTSKEQSNNRSTNRWIEFNGKKLTITQWEQETGLSRVTISDRIKAGWHLDKVFSKIDGRTHCPVTCC